MKLLITAGPTREYFDSVRFISNSSSGKMGYAIAAEAADRGHTVVLISGPVQFAAPGDVEVVRVTGAREMFDAATERFVDCAAAIMAAAVCDFRPAHHSDHKIEKHREALAVEFEQTEDICAHLGRIKKDRVVVGFAMEDHDHHQHAEGKLQRKRCDAIVLNDLGNVGGTAGSIEILRADRGWSPPYSGSKAELAVVIVDLVEELAGQGGAR